MRLIELDVADLGFVDPALGKTVGDQEMIGVDGLALHAGDAAFDERARLLIIRSDDRKSRRLRHRVLRCLAHPRA